MIHPALGKDLSQRRTVILKGKVQLQIRTRYLIYTCLLFLFLAGLSTFAMMLGDYQLSATQVFQALTGEGKKIAVYFVQEVRAPRVVAALLVGAALGISGSIFQTISGNALGSPDIIGFTNGAATGALINIILFNAGPTGVALGAVLGGTATSCLIYLLTRKHGLKGFRLVLVGIGVGSTLAALNSLLVVRASLSQAQTAASWLAGSLNTMNWSKVLFLLCASIILWPLCAALSRNLSLIRYGDAIALGLGVQISTVRIAALFVSVLLVSFATATTGPLAFVALSAPHIAHKISGQVSLLAAALTGAAIVLASDLIGQYVLPNPVQVGVVTGGLGAIYLVYLMIVERKKA